MQQLGETGFSNVARKDFYSAVTKDFGTLGRISGVVEHYNLITAGEQFICDCAPEKPLAAQTMVRTSPPPNPDQSQVLEVREGTAPP
jgi:hypothetical protein